MKPKDQRVQNILNVVALMSMVLIVGCDIESCDPIKGTLETKNEPYKGKPGATAPHADDPSKIIPGPVSCDSYTKQCGYFPLVRTGVHNPTDRVVVAHVRCSFFVGDWNTGQVNERKGVKVNPYSTKYVELQFNISVQGDQQHGFRADCDTYFK